MAKGMSAGKSEELGTTMFSTLNVEGEVDMVTNVCPLAWRMPCFPGDFPGCGKAPPRLTLRGNPPDS